MNFKCENLQKLVLSHRLSCNAFGRAECDNYLFEQRGSEKRLEHFEAQLGKIDAYDCVQTAHNDYYSDFVCVDEGFCPATFEPGLGPAYLGPIDTAQKLVRLESISRPLFKLGMSFKELTTAQANGQTSVIEVFLDAWNKSRDCRPAFATFKDQIVDEIGQSNWPENLRNRLGLAHYNCSGGEPIPIVLVEYTIDEILESAPTASISTALTVPTVLDSGPWPFFFPSPENLNFGRTMSLNKIFDDEDLLVEVLHTKIEYQVHHLIQFGEIGAPPPVTNLTDLRNTHLFALQVAANDELFGEEIP